jgi:hypothetical protein
MENWVLFWLGSWAFVIGLTSWSFYRLLSDQGKKHFDPDGIGPASPPVPGRAEVKTKGKKK